MHSRSSDSIIGIYPKAGEIGNRLRALGVTDIDPIYSGAHRAAFRVFNNDLGIEYLVMLEFEDLAHTIVTRYVIQKVQATDNSDSIDLGH